MVKSDIKSRVVHKAPNVNVLSFLGPNLVRKAVKLVAKDDSKRKGFSTKMAIKYSSAEIENNLKVKVVTIKKVKKVYGSNTNSFEVKVRSEHNEFFTYFLKFGRDKYINDELKGDTSIQGKLNTPRVILSSKRKFLGYEWILYEHIEGSLMSEVFSNIRDQRQFNAFLKLEKSKELKLIALHSQLTGLLDYNSYIKSRANKLFHGRLVGRRYKEFYKKGGNNISKMFNRKIILNGQVLPITIAQIISNIRNKYTNRDDTLRVEAILGHGDAHHGNIIVNDKIWFIDNEYAGATTPLMEIAKPYYNDFFGDIFFYGIKTLDKLLKIHSFEDDGTNINVKMEISREFQRYITLANIKLELRSKFVNGDTKDYISLNDYLFLCHILTKNPNKYSSKSQKQFLVLAIVIQLFDPHNPKSIYSFFK